MGYRDDLRRVSSEIERFVEIIREMQRSLDRIGESLRQAEKLRDYARSLESMGSKMEAELNAAQNTIKKLEDQVKSLQSK